MVYAGEEIAAAQSLHEMVVASTASVSGSGTPADRAYALAIAAGIREEEEEEDLQVPEEACRALRKLAEKRQDIADAHAFRLLPLKGALTNQVFECRWSRDHVGKRPKKVLVRVYGNGSHLFFNRQDEEATFEHMSARKQGPRMLARFPNGRVEEFLHARTLTAEDLRDPGISARIAAKLSEFHGLDIPLPKQAMLWERMSWLESALQVCTEEQIEEFGLHRLGQEMDGLKSRLSKVWGAIGFCHNDLQYGNIMLDEEDKCVTLIDYEYASYNPVAFDLANHFCEMAANYHTHAPHVLHFSKYPDLQERCTFVKNYLQASGDDAAKSESDVEKLTRHVECYTLASHILWALWGIISSRKSEIDFDFQQYARQRLERYRNLQGKVFAALD